jgi:hypothetical protein
MIKVLSILLRYFHDIVWNSIEPCTLCLAPVLASMPKPVPKLDRSYGVLFGHVQACSRHALDVSWAAYYLASSTPASIDVAVLKREVN